MAGAELPLRRYRVVVQLSVLASTLLVVFGLWQALQGQWWLAGLGLVGGLLLLWPSHHYKIAPEAGSETQLVFLTREQCTLCDEARTMLATLVADSPFQVVERDVDQDRFLKRHFGPEVPVLLWQGEPLAKLRFEADAVRARLAEIRARLPHAGQKSP